MKLSDLITDIKLKRNLRMIEEMPRQILSKDDSRLLNQTGGSSLLNIKMKS